MSVSYRVLGVNEIRKWLKAYTGPELRKRMKRATKAGAEQLRGPLRSESRNVSQRMGKAVSVVATPRTLAGKITRLRGGDVGTYIGYRRKTAFFAHFVVGGTKDHGPRRARAMVFRGKDGGWVRTRHVRGVKANPIPSRVASRHEGAVYHAVDRDLDKTEPK